MKRLLLASVAIAALCSAPALAADVPVKAPLIKPAPVFDWSGFYIGANAGYGWGNSTWTANTSGLFINDPGDQFRTHPRGGIAGGEIGYNWQNGQLVLGLELSGSAGSMKDTNLRTLLTETHTQQTEIRALWTATAKLGFAAARDLVYVKGGYASARIKINATSNDGAGITFGADKARSGLTFGAGWDHALTPNWIFGVEFNYHDFRSAEYSGVNSIGNPESFAVRSTVQSVVARVSYRFGS